MYIYNVTVNIEESIQEQWLAWMQDTHIPDMLATGKFLHATMCKVLVDEEMGGITYAIQYTTPNKVTLDRYYKEDTMRLQKESQLRFADKVVAFRTELEIVNQQ